MLKEKLCIMIIIVSTLISIYMMLSIKNLTNNLTQQIAILNTTLQKENVKNNVLKTELAYLSRPERIKSLARQYLTLHPTLSSQIIYHLGQIHKKPELVVHKATYHINTFLQPWRYKNLPNQQ